MSATQSTPAKFPTWVRLTLYSVWFSLSFTVCLYFSISSSVGALRAPVESALEQALGKGKQGRYGVDPKVTIGGISLWRLSGVELRRVSMQLASTDPDPGPVIELDAVRARVGLFQALLGNPTLQWQAELYKGEAEGQVQLRGAKAFEDKLYGTLRAVLAGKSDGVTEINFTIQGVDLSQALFVQSKAKVPVTGTVRGNVQLELGEKPEEEANGLIDVAVSGIQLGPGELAIPMPGLSGGLTLPLVDFGDFNLRVPVEKGTGKTEKLSLMGRDVQASFDGTVQMARPFERAKLEGGGDFLITPKFLEENGKFKALLDFAGPLKKVQQEDGKYPFHVKGTWKRPGFALGEASKTPDRKDRKNRSKRKK